MPGIKKKIEEVACSLLLRTGVPESQLMPVVRKTGRGMLLASILLVVPLVLMDTVPLIATIVLQMGYATLMCLGVILAFDDDKKRR